MPGRFEPIAEFDVPCLPVSWKRPTPGGGGKAYTDAGDAAHRNAVALIAQSKRTRMAQKGEAVRLTVVFVLPTPKGASPAEAEQMIALSRVLPTGAPDLDNLVKGIQDAMSGIVYADDAQVCSYRIDKIYGAEPKTLIQVDVMHPAALTPADGPPTTRPITDH